MTVTSIDQKQEMNTFPKTQNTRTISDIPLDVIKLAFSFLPNVNQAKSACVNREFHQAAISPLALRTRIRELGSLIFSSSENLKGLRAQKKYILSAMGTCQSESKDVVSLCLFKIFVAEILLTNNIEKGLDVLKGLPFTLRSHITRFDLTRRVAEFQNFFNNDFYAELLAQCPEIIELGILWNFFDDVGLARTLSRHSKIQSLRIEGGGEIQEGFFEELDLPSLVDLRLEVRSITDNACCPFFSRGDLIRRLQRLYININNSKFTGRCLSTFSWNNQIQDLTLCSGYLEEQPLRNFFKRLFNVRKLKIISWEFFPVHALESFQNTSSLEKFCYVDYGKISDEEERCVAELINRTKRLKEIEVTVGSETGCFFSSIAAPLNLLERFTLRFHVSERFPIEGLLEFLQSKVPNLQELTLSNSLYSAYEKSIQELTPEDKRRQIPVFYRDRSLWSISC